MNLYTYLLFPPSITIILIFLLTFYWVFVSKVSEVSIVNCILKDLASWHFFFSDILTCDSRNWKDLQGEKKEIFKRHFFVYRFLIVGKTNKKKLRFFSTDKTDFFFLPDARRGNKKKKRQYFLKPGDRDWQSVSLLNYNYQLRYHTQPRASYRTARTPFHRVNFKPLTFN